MKYKRLQVGQIWLRTVIEIVLIIAAISVCSVLIVSSYEESFFQATQDTSSETTAQLGHSISGIVDPALLSVEDEERAQYIKAHYEQLLNDCFVSGDTLNSGAIYRVTPGGPELYVSSKAYSISDEQTAELKAAALSGETVSHSYESANYIFIPVKDGATNQTAAVIAVSSVYRSTMEYHSLVRSRLETIAIVSGVLIIVYYSISGIISEKKKRTAVSVE